MKTSLYFGFALCCILNNLEKFVLYPTSLTTTITMYLRNDSLRTQWSDTKLKEKKRKKKLLTHYTQNTASVVRDGQTKFFPIESSMSAANLQQAKQ